VSTHDEHDGFHPVRSDDAAWIETLWLPFWVMERDLSVYVRVVFQPNAGRYRGSVAVWSGDDRLHFEGALSGSFDSLESLGDLRSLELPGGLRHDCLEPARRYGLRYAHEACSIEAVFEALTEPEYPPPEDSPGMFAGHLDQHGRMSGRMRLGREELEIECGTVRDRSWGPRVVRSDLRLGNAHGTGRDEAFFAYIQGNEEGEEKVVGGSLWREGVSARLVDGLRRIEWSGDWPARVRIQARDALGRSLEAEGRCRNRRAVVANPELYAVLNLVEWTLGDRRLEGENHDVWSRQAWLAAGREPLEGDR